jgi:ribosomal-protein-alanine N-acetyltransferase
MRPEALAALHATAFTDTPRPWSSAEFASLLAAPGIVLVSDADGFALARLAGPEAELLTLAVSPLARRRGLATRLLHRLFRRTAEAGAEEMFLEVAVPNLAARALYERLGFVETGRRPRYYTRSSGPPVDALVLRRPLI